jgi:hypothetical protein
VTPGYGVNIATKSVLGMHNQRVIAHTDGSRLFFSPSADPSKSYAYGQCIGGEVAVRDAVRAAAETAWLVGVVVTLANAAATGGIDFDLILRSEPLQTPPVDGSSLSVAAAEMRNMLGVVHVKSSDFSFIGGHGVANLAVPSLLLVGASGSPSVYAVAVARGAVSLAAADALGIALSVQRD